MRKLLALFASLALAASAEAQIQWKAGTTSRTVALFVGDSSSTTGAGLGGLVYNTGSLVCSYQREKAARVAITLATQTVTGAYSSGGFVEIDATNMKGLYRLDLPDAAVAAGVAFVVVECHGAANMAQVMREIQLQSLDVEDAVRAGLTALPNVASGSAGAIPTTGTGSNQINVSGGRADANVTYYGGAAGTFASGRPEVNTTHWSGTANAAPNTAGYPVVTVKDGTGPGEIDTASGHVANVDTLTTYTGNTPQTGDSYAVVSNVTYGNAAIKGYVDDIGVAGAGLTALGDTRLAYLDAAVSSRGTGTALDAAGVRSAVGLASANLDTQIDALPTAAENADAGWDEAISGHLTAGTTGAKLNSAASAGDPLTNTVPGSYVTGTAGYVLGHLDDDGRITVVVPAVVSGTTITVNQGDDYRFADSQQIPFTGLTGLTGTTVNFHVYRPGQTVLTVAATIVSATECYVELTATQTAAIEPGTYEWGLLQTLANTHKYTRIRSGVFKVLPKINP